MHANSVPPLAGRRVVAAAPGALLAGGCGLDGRRRARRVLGAHRDHRALVLELLDLRLELGEEDDVGAARRLARVARAPVGAPAGPTSTAVARATATSSRSLRWRLSISPK